MLGTTVPEPNSDGRVFVCSAGVSAEYRKLVISVLNGIREAPTLFDALPADRPHISDKMRRQVYERDGWACVECGSPEDLTVDHKWPHIRGGISELSNYQTLCKIHNSAKGDRTDGVA